MGTLEVHDTRPPEDWSEKVDLYVEEVVIPGTQQLDVRVKLLRVFRPGHYVPGPGGLAMRFLLGTHALLTPPGSFASGPLEPCAG